MAIFIRNAAFLLRDAQRIERDAGILIERNRISAVGAQAHGSFAAAAAAMVRSTTVFVLEPGATARYDDLFATWRELYPALRLLFAQLDRMR